MLIISVAEQFVLAISTRGPAEGGRADSVDSESSRGVQRVRPLKQFQGSLCSIPAVTGLSLCSDEVTWRVCDPVRPPLRLRRPGRVRVLATGIDLQI